MAAPLSGQTLNDRILAARHSLAGQGLAKAVCKATTEELIGPKKKHLDYLLHCTEEPNVSIPTLANLLIERCQNQNWIVVFKSLVTIHHMMCYGNERFVQYLASSNTSFQLSNFLDKSGVQGYDMSPFVRRYAKYLTEKSVSYRTVAFDFCKVKRGKEGGTLRQMAVEKLLKTLPVLQAQLDALLDFEVTTADLTNGVINSAFMLLFRDLIRLFACYNDGIINLLEKYFDMNKKNCRDALDTYKKFLVRMDRVAEFLKVAESVGVDRTDIPDLAKAPSSLLEALEAHLANLEGRKVGSPDATSPMAGSGKATQLTDKLQQQLLEEEEQAMAKYKEQKNSSTNPFAVTAPAPDPKAAKEAAATPNILDLFGMPDPGPPTTTDSGGTAAGGGSSSDLLQLSGNPFASIMSGGQQQPPAPATQAAAAPNFFGGANILQPQASQGTDMFGGANAFGGMPAPLMATNGAGHTQAPPDQKQDGKALVSGDLDASLANLTSNLNLASGPGNFQTSQSQVRGPPMNHTGSSLGSISSFQTQPMFQQHQRPVPPMGNTNNTTNSLL